MHLLKVIEKIIIDFYAEILIHLSPTEV